MSSVLGRPKERKEPSVMSIVVEKRVAEALASIAKREGKSRSKLAEEVLRKFAQAHLNDNSQFRLDHDWQRPEMQAFPTLGENPDVETVTKADDKMLKIIHGQASAWQWFAKKEMEKRSLI